MISLMVKNNVITDYAKGSGLVGDNVVQYSGNIPDDFYSKFKSSFYLLENDAIVENPDYVAPSNDVPTGPTDTQTILKAMASQMADHCEAIDKLDARIDALEN